MGGERASKTRMREAGRICCYCGRILSAPFPARERLCARCEVERMGLKRMVLMQFERRDGWRVSFRDNANPQTTFREFRFAQSTKIQDLVQRTGTPLMSEDRNALEYGIRQGSGAIPLQLSDDQYRKLLR
jgi:hypothetical protein